MREVHTIALVLPVALLATIDTGALPREAGRTSSHVACRSGQIRTGLMAQNLPTLVFVTCGTATSAGCHDISSAHSPAVQYSQRSCDLVKPLVLSIGN